MSWNQSLFGNGVNLQPSYYGNPRGYVSFGWDLMKGNANINTVRIEIEPGMEVPAANWIQQACGRHRYKVIATYHNKDKLGSNSPSDLMDAATWWVANYSNLLYADASHWVQMGDTLSAIAQLYYGDAKKYHELFQRNRHILTSPHKIYPNQELKIPAAQRSFMINLMNEWGNHDVTATEYANAYNAAIETVRRVYPAGPLIIDVPGWGQETAVAASAVRGHGTANGVRIIGQEIILSVHIYPSAFVQQKRASSKEKSGWLTNPDLDDLDSAGRPCMVGEFGSVGKGNASWGALVDHAKNLNWPVLGWAWNGDGGDPNDPSLPQMNMVQPFWAPSINKNPHSFPIVPNPPYFRTILGKL